MVKNCRSDSNNKRLGTEFENETVDVLNKIGYWVHFISPNAQGAQPFDVIAVKNCHPLAIDCKTSAIKRFNITRLEENQINAFEKWMRCGNTEPLVFVRYEGYIYVVKYLKLKEQGYVRLEKNPDDELEESVNYAYSNK